MTDRYQQLRRLMVENQLIPRGITDPRVLAAMAEVPRHLFVPDNLRDAAYSDNPLPIGHNQTISQPLVVAHCCQLLRLTGREKVLDVGTGSGYQAAVLSRLAATVHSIEIIPQLAARAAKILKRLGYGNVNVITADAAAGSPQRAPFDAIVSAAATDRIPAPWKQQLKTGGRLVTPLKTSLGQTLIRLIKTKKGFRRHDFGPVLFVPLVR